MIQQGWADAAKRKARTAEQIAAMERVEEEFVWAGERIGSYDITYREEDDVFVIRDKNGEIVDTTGDAGGCVRVGMAD